tara:strand:+ start:925 stop:1212 length:288 start_codon:yes stop_codon:yes gene_type:complete
MKKYLTEKNLMWAAIVALAAMALTSCGVSDCCGQEARFQKAMKGRMELAKDAMRGRMQGQRRGSRGDSGKGAWVTREALVDGEKKGRKRGPKDAE